MMKRKWVLVLDLVLIVGLAGCSHEDTVVMSAESGYVEDVDQRVRGIDWSKAEPVTVFLESYKFSPSQLSFRVNQPYVLRLSNIDTSTHSFHAPGFFKAIAANTLTTTQGPKEVTLHEPRIEDIMVPPGALKELQFVPVKPGNYSLDSSKSMEAVMGMTGSIDIAGNAANPAEPAESAAPAPAPAPVPGGGSDRIEAQPLPSLPK